MNVAMLASTLTRLSLLGQIIQILSIENLHDGETCFT
jgi:hypothetical protein